MNKKMVNITEVCREIFAGGDAPKNRMSIQKTAQYTIPIYSNGEVNDGLYGYTDFARVTSPSITISARGTIGYTSIRNEPFVPIVRLITITPKTEIIDINYLYYAVKNIKLSGSGTSIPQLTVPMLKKYNFPLLPLNEQAKVAMILGKVDSLISTRRQQLATLDELVKSRFVEMFGNPFDSRTENKWPIMTISELAESISDGSNVDKKKYLDSGDVLFLRIQNVWFNEFRLDDSVYITNEINNRYADTSLKHGDLLITKIGRYYTADSSLGRVCVYLGEDDKANYSNNIMRVRFDSRVDSEFVNVLMNLDDYNKYIKRSSVGGTDKRALSKSLISSFPIIVPPMEEQKNFLEFVHQADKTKSTIQASLDEMETLKKSLMQEYFG